MGLYRVDELDQDGKRSIHSWGVFRADSGKEAREKAAKFYKNKEMVTTGFYHAFEVTEERLIERRLTLEKLIKTETEIVM